MTHSPSQPPLHQPPEWLLADREASALCPQLADDALAVARVLDLGQCASQALRERFVRRGSAWENMASAEDPVAEWLVGLCLLHGVDGQANRALALELLERSAGRGFGPACHSLAKSGSTTLERAASLYMQAAKAGFGPAMCNLGVAFFEGEGIGPCCESGLRWLNSALDAGNAVAGVNLALCFADGLLGEEDPSRAASYYKRAADRGHAGALCLLGMCYEDGTGVAPDLGQAFECYRLAAEAGDLEAQVLLGECYDQARGTERDLNAAVAWYRRAAEAGHPHARVALASCLLHGDGLAADPVQAVKWFALAAEDGDPEACYQLGLCYTRGEGTDQDHASAVELYRRCVAAKHPDGTYALGVAHSRGDGVEKSLELAFRYFEAAAELGSEPAIEALQMTPCNGDDPCGMVGGLLSSLGEENLSFAQAKSVGCALMESLAGVEKAEVLSMAECLADAIRGESPEPAGIAAMVAGALVEHGACSGTFANAIMDSLPRVLKNALRFVDLCEERHSETDPDELLEFCSLPEHLDRWVAEHDRSASEAWHTLDFWCQPSVSILARAPDVRSRAADDPCLRRTAAALGMVHPGAKDLAILLTVPDALALKVLVEDERRAFDVTLTGVTDIFQLQTLLASALVGREGQGLEGRRPDPDVIAVADGSGPPRGAAETVANWSFHTPRSDRPGAALRRLPIDASIASLGSCDGVHALVLRSTVAPARWTAVRSLGPVVASVDVTRELSKEETDALASRLGINES